MQIVNKYGKLLLSAYIVKNMKAGGSLRNGGMLSKYVKLALGAYLLNKLKPGKTKKEIEVEPEDEMILSRAEKVETGNGSSMKIGKVILGALAGVTLLYAIKKQAAKKRGYKIEVE